MKYVKKGKLVNRVDKAMYKNCVSSVKTRIEQEKQNGLTGFQQGSVLSHVLFIKNIIQRPIREAANL